MQVTGFLELPLWGYGVVLLILTQITIASVTLFLHRNQSHKSVEFHPIVSHFFRFWLWLTTGTVTQEWVAVHRWHHATTDSIADPHSPQIKGIKKVLFGGFWLYKEATKNQKMIEKYGQGTPDDWLEKNIYATRTLLGIFTLLGIELILFGVAGCLIWLLQMIWIPFWAAGIINGVGHYWGYRNSECPDASTNIVPWAFIVGGEELHNNHHDCPTSAKFSLKAWEFDLGWFYLRLLSFFRLARVHHIAPKVRVVPRKVKVDLDALKAVFASRFRVLSLYGKEVILPVLKEEAAKKSAAGRSIVLKARHYLMSHEGLLKPLDKEVVHNALAISHGLQVVYQYRQKLQSIWQKTSASPKELLESLQEWCKQAEATGIEALQRFSTMIRGYALV